MTEKAFLTELLALLKMGKADAAARVIETRLGKGEVTTNSGGVPPRPPKPPVPDEP